MKQSNTTDSSNANQKSGLQVSSEQVFVAAKDSPSVSKENTSPSTDSTTGSGIQNEKKGAVIENSVVAKNVIPKTSVINENDASPKVDATIPKVEQDQSKPTDLNFKTNTESEANEAIIATATQESEEDTQNTNDVRNDLQFSETFLIPSLKNNPRVTGVELYRSLREWNNRRWVVPKHSINFAAKAQSSKKTTSLRVPKR